MYADDAKLYAPIYNDTTVSLVQDDLDRLAQWCHKWRLRVNPSKCFQIQYNPKSAARSMSPVYSIENQILQRKTEGRDLGIIVSEDLKFHKHIDSMRAKANREVNRIRRSFITRSPRFLSEMYKLYVRPHMEYIVELWNPCYAGDIMKLEKVQNNMTRMLNLGQHMTPEQRNEMLGLTSHEDRRRRGDLIAMFKHVGTNRFFELRDSSRTRGHDKCLKAPAPRNVLKSQSFACRRVAEWNRLPNDVVIANSVNQFKTKIDQYI